MDFSHFSDDCATGGAANAYKEPAAIQLYRRETARQSVPQSIDESPMRFHFDGPLGNWNKFLLDDRHQVVTMTPKPTTRRGKNRGILQIDCGITKLD